MAKQFTHYMQLALELAAKGELTCPPNPQVGCVIVNDGQVVGTGYHMQTGQPHAEIHALAEAKHLAKGADVYVTLEPCSHHGRTPPCVQALIQACVRRVIIPFADPNPRVSGYGINALKAANIEVISGVGADEAALQNRRFLTYMQTGKPYVIAKWAMTTDGKLCLPGQKFISNEQARMHAHRLRQQVDAILVGKQTILADNPALTNRYMPLPENLRRHPLRLVISKEANLPTLDSDKLQLANPHLPGETWWLSPQALAADAAQTHLPNVHNWQLQSENGQLSMDGLLTFLGKQGVSSVLVEGGSKTLAWFFAQNSIDEVHIYLNTAESVAIPMRDNCFYKQLTDFTELAREPILDNSWIQYIHTEKLNHALGPVIYKSLNFSSLYQKKTSTDSEENHHV